ncbi:polysaccharide deacetylase family protein [Roseovarius nubinhibens]|uniref:polysaccharide deacetylase family protein n=1 Tax=Roseovarius nubinhibens TaxID=314263 RepID=UPI00030BF83B|nr:polysaccharide deacetylase family protein [Roseovarius nubinhibens]
MSAKSDLPPLQQEGLQVSLPQRKEEALKWVCDFVFGQAIPGLQLSLHDQDHIEISAAGKTLIFASLFPQLDLPREEWSQQSPAEPLQEFSAEAVESFTLPLPIERMPILFGGPEVAPTATGLKVDADLFGGIFFLLSRFEEIVSAERDTHDRFPGSASLAYREKFLSHPLADIYRHAIWALVSLLWPGLKMPKYPAQPIHVSCDVDEPFDRSVRSPAALLRTLAGDLLKRRSPALAAKRLVNFAFSSVFGLRFDPCYTFDWYMNICEAHGVRATFYFIAGKSAGLIDGTYEIEDPRIANLLRAIARRGHRIGMHGSYNTYKDIDRLKRERLRLVVALEAAGVPLDVLENRQHYLRWDAALTPDCLSAAGFKMDTSGGFADMAGFRYGTGRPFRMWSWQRLEPLDLTQKPLIVMEGSLLSPLYQQLSFEEALATVLSLKQKTTQYGGEFSLLWHNSELLIYQQKSIFQAALASQLRTPVSQSRY